MLNLINPATEEVFCSLTKDNIHDVQKRYEQALRAQQTWKDVPYKEKKAVVEKFIEHLTADKAKCAKILSQEMGKPVHQAAGEITATTSRVQWFVDHVEQQLQEKITYERSDFKEKITWEPLGVVAHISAWNFPYFIGTNVIIPALLTGNAVLYKPSNITSMTGSLIAELMRKAGLPKDLLQVFIGRGDLGGKILELPLQGVFFTGSYEIGTKVAASFIKHFPKVVLELGGKDPAYVCDDSPIEKTAEQLVDGAFYNAGQSCCAVERIYVHKDCYDSFVDCFVEKAKSLVVGDPLDKNTYMGPLAQKDQVAFLAQQLTDAENQGAKVVLDGRAAFKERGGFMGPSVVLGVDHTMDIMTQESFGPIIGIQKVSDDQEAIRLMNDTPFGLTASVHTLSQKRAFDILSKVDAGTVYWNSCDRVSPYVPWSGRKQSGVGSTLSEVSIPYFIQPKAWQMRNLV